MDVIKAVAVQQPEVTRLAARDVSIDVKTWMTDYRGPILLVSATTPRIEPAGYAIALARLADCRPMAKADEKRAGKSVYPGARAWVYEDVEPIKIFPVDVRSDVFDVAIPPFGLRTIAKVVLVPDSYQRTHGRRAAPSASASAAASAPSSAPPRPPAPLHDQAMAAAPPAGPAGGGLTVEAQSPPPPGPDGPRLDVLVVVGHQLVGRGVRRLLAPRHDARVVTSVAAGLEEIARREPDAVICDSELGMPDCAALFERLAASFPRVRRILYASSRPEIWLRSVDGRLVQRAVLKPASELQLLGAVAS
jgi:hypothetical protein